MKAPYMIKYNDQYYNVGDELPPEVEALIKPKYEEQQKRLADIKKNKPANILTKTVKNNQLSLVFIAQGMPMCVPYKEREL